MALDRDACILKSMRREWFWGGAALLCALAACATSTAPSSGGGTSDGDAGDIPLYDAGGTPTGEASSTCTLGGADHCGTCTTVCPGPADPDAGTRRVCSDSTTTATCDIICEGEHYDLNGVVDDGCEGEDPIVHDNADAAVPETATTAGFTVGDPYWYVYGDARQHADAPTSRPLGREDWYVVSNPHGTPKACLSITNFPSDNQFEVCITNNGNKNIEAAQCKTILPTTGAANDCVQPGSAPTNGTYWVRVRKLDGSNTANGYALFIQD